MVASIPNDIFQFSTHAAIKAKYSIGQPRAADLTSHGTDGIGIFEDGSHMILLGEQAYTIRKDGSVVPAPMDARLPFAMVTIFRPTYRIQVSELSLESLQDVLESSELGVAKGVNTLVPFKITSTFSFVSFEGAGSRTNIAGTIFGFVVPVWMKDISGPRVHASFLGEDGAKGGLVAEFEVKNATLGFAKCGRFHLGFPQGPEWEDVKLSCD